MACDVAALLGERDILRGAGRICTAAWLLSGEERARAVQGGVQRARQLARQYRGYLRGKASSRSPIPIIRAGSALLALAYPDRVAQQRRAGGAEYRLANGRAALFAEASLMKEPWLVIADLGSRQGQREERIYLAADFDPALFDSVLAEQVRAVDQLDWDEREGVLRAERQRKVGELVLSREPLTGLDAARSQALVNLVRRKGLELLPWTPELRQWQARVALLRQLDLAARPSEWPDVSDARCSKPALADALSGQGLATESFRQSGPVEHRATCCPGRCRSAWTSWHRITSACRRARRSVWITASQPPILAVRLQELFGLAETPRIAGGRQWSSCTCCPRRGGRCR
jgi:ATP-dependent helicase HrpB